MLVSATSSMTRRCCKPFPRGTLLVLVMSGLLCNVQWFLFSGVAYSINAVRANRISYLRPFCTSVPSSLFSDRLERESLVGVQGPANSRAGIL